MTPADLRAIGERLYGSAWRCRLAAALEVNERTVRRWLAGTTPIPAGLAREIATALRRIAAEIDRAA